ncbi:MAG: flagellar hook-length control protein FliK, partial [Micavibrio aeruginosavorus]
QALERALASAGFDASADGISFELAQDNSAFSRGDDKNADQSGGKSSRGMSIAGIEGEEIIQSSVAWQVDPSTGHVRYNIFA